MYHVTETKKQNVSRKADKQHAAEATYVVLRHGAVLLRNGNKTRNIEGDEAESFINKVRNRAAGYVKVVVKGYFETATA